MYRFLSTSGMLSAEMSVIKSELSYDFSRIELTPDRFELTMDRVTADLFDLSLAKRL